MYSSFPPLDDLVGVYSREELFMLILERGGIPVFILHCEIPIALGLFLQFIVKVFR